LPVGIFEKERWEQGTARPEPGDLLVLYSDRITEAQDSDDRSFGQERLLASLCAGLDPPAFQPVTARGVRNAVLDGLHAFVGAAPQSDDITLVVVVRGPAGVLLSPDTA
jgi:sigma-B regulation protein RsbU (phosphoserine phosphatase)